MLTTLLKFIPLLLLSNIFMTFAWYSHLKHVGKWPLLFAIFTSWGLAFFEYCLTVPANRIGYTSGITLPQLKILQEVVTLIVFIPFYTLYMQQSFSWNYIWAACCILGAVYFVFK